MGINNSSDAQEMALWEHLLPLLSFRRGPWCSETIAYWHREAGIPYSKGYRNSWHPSWKIKNTKGVRIWYKTEEKRGSKSRGRWIAGIELDVANFKPGINAPCPGAYQQLEGWGASKGWSGPNNAHSQMIQDITVYRTASGRIIRIDVTMLEGNAGNQVKNTTKYENIADYTRYGSKFISGNRKIRGWGIDLDRNGNPIYDANRIKYVQETAAAKEALVIAKPAKEQDDDAALVDALVTFSKRVDEMESTPIKEGTALKFRLPDYDIASRWTMRANQDSQFEVSFPEPHPVPVKGILLTLEGGAPEHLNVEWAGAGKQFQSLRQLTLRRGVGTGESAQRQPKGPMSIRIEHTQALKVQHLRFTAPKGSLSSDAHITSVDLEFDWGDEDAEVNP
jgi:hypothetical protein